MNIRVKTSDYKMEPDVKAYLDEKLVAIEKVISDEAARCEIDVGRAAGHSQQGKIWKADIVLTHFGERLKATAQEEGIKAALDIAKDEIVTLLKKSKNRTATLKRHIGTKLKKFARRGDMRSY